MKKLLFILMLFVASCGQRSKTYNVTIITLDGTDTTKISAASDTVAFKEAVNMYWGLKKYREDNNDIRLPIMFSLLDKDFHFVHIDEREKEILARPIIKHYQDSITPVTQPDTSYSADIF